MPWMPTSSSTPRVQIHEGNESTNIEIIEELERRSCHEASINPLNHPIVQENRQNGIRKWCSLTLVIRYHMQCIMSWLCERVCVRAYVRAHAYAFEREKYFEPAEITVHVDFRRCYIWSYLSALASHGDGDTCDRSTNFPICYSSVCKIHPVISISGLDVFCIAEQMYLTTFTFNHRSKWARLNLFGTAIWHPAKSGTKICNRNTCGCSAFNSVRPVLLP